MMSDDYWEIEVYDVEALAGVERVDHEIVFDCLRDVLGYDQ